MSTKYYPPERPYHFLGSFQPLPVIGRTAHQCTESVKMGFWLRDLLNSHLRIHLATKVAGTYPPTAVTVSELSRIDID